MIIHRKMNIILFFAFQPGLYWYNEFRILRLHTLNNAVFLSFLHFCSLKNKNVHYEKNEKQCNVFLFLAL